MELAALARRTKAYGLLAACAAVGVLTTVLIPLPLTLLIGRRFRREDVLRRVHLMGPWARFCARRVLALRLDVVGQAQVPSSSRGHLFICNHQSYVDIVALVVVLRTGAFLAKSTVAWFPFIGAAAYAAGSVFVRRNDAASRRQALAETMRMCAESTGVIVFPEGTRSSNGELRSRIHPGAIIGAFEHGLRVIPVGLDGTHRVTPKSNDRVNRQQPVAVTVGAPMNPADFPDPETWTQAVWARVGELFTQSRDRLIQR
ncbi:MAG: 1-acyl-sn-glycerol-3-phosphate acyltransferase [Proteobacteria bacterium]|nr:1-acyl-sn-glycerol-3-phosphate acyltransferase [Pseudomonadota bacterium]